LNDFALVTDSSCSLPQELVQEYSVAVVPIYIEWQGRFVRDGLDVGPDQVYDYLRMHPEAAVKTSTPSPAEFLAVYDRLLAEHEQVLSIHLAGTLTSIVDIARQAAGAREPGQIEVVDSRTASMGLGFAVLAAARARERGEDRALAAGEARNVGETSRLFGVMETLKYVKSSGRLVGLGAKAASSLRLRPLIVVADGQVRFLGVVRTRGRGIAKVVELVKEQSRGRPVHLAVVHAGVPGEAQKLSETLSGELDCVETVVSAFTPVLGGHTGPGFIGVTVYPEAAEAGHEKAGGTVRGREQREESA
jgi:DegV family protein with EDD domain